MLNKKQYRIAAVCGLLALVFQGSSFAQKSADPSQLIKASVTVDSDTLARQKPGVVTITIANIAGREIHIKSICSFELLSLGKEAVSRNHSVFGDSYWSPINIATGTPLSLNVIDPKMLKKGVVVGRVPEAVLHFAKDETKTFKSDLTKLLWNASMGSDWPRWNLFEVVPKGSYTLLFAIQSGGHVKSNKVKVSVE